MAGLVVTLSISPANSGSVRLLSCWSWRVLPLLRKKGMETARVGMRERPKAASKAEVPVRVVEVLVTLEVAAGRMLRVSSDTTAGRDWELTMADGMPSWTGALVVASLPVI